MICRFRRDDEECQRVVKGVWGRMGGCIIEYTAETTLSHLMEMKSGWVFHYGLTGGYVFDLCCLSGCAWGGESIPSNIPTLLGTV